MLGIETKSVYVDEYGDNVKTWGECEHARFECFCEPEYEAQAERRLKSRIMSFRKNHDVQCVVPGERFTCGGFYKGNIYMSFLVYKANA